MDIRDIELIEAVHRTGSLSKACGELSISQPTLSKRLARLERTLGAELFFRYSTGLVATPVADYVLAQSHQARSQLRDIKRHVELMTSLDSGELRLGVGPIVEQLMLPQVLSRFLETTGDVSVSIVAEDDQTLLRLFADAELDIIVGPFSASEQSTDHIRGFEMVSDNIVAVVRASHPLYGADITEATFAQYPLIAPKAQGTVRGQNIPAAFNNLKIVSDNYDSLRSLTLSSDAICMGPRAVFAAQLQSGDLVELPLPMSVEWKSALLVKRETYTTPLARHLVGLFEIVAKEVNESLR